MECKPWILEGFSELDSKTRKEASPFALGALPLPLFLSIFAASSLSSQLPWWWKLKCDIGNRPPVLRHTPSRTHLFFLLLIRAQDCLLAAEVSSKLPLIVQSWARSLAKETPNKVISYAFRGTGKMLELQKNETPRTFWFSLKKFPARNVDSDTVLLEPDQATGFSWGREAAGRVV